MAGGLASIAPFFIVRDVDRAAAFYRDCLGFAVLHMSPQPNSFFAIVGRDGARILLKAIAPEIGPLPNSQRHPWARWDAYVDTPDPDELADEFRASGMDFREPLADTGEGLRGFAVSNADGYILFFGRPSPMIDPT